jgi:hypothetical protein
MGMNAGEYVQFYVFVACDMLVTLGLKNKCDDMISSELHVVEHAQKKEA